MQWLRTIARELLGLVVDDFGFAVTILAWIACAWALSAYVLQPAPWGAVLLFAGLGLILFENVARRAGEHR